VIDANAVVQGPREAPDVDLRVDVKGAGAKPAGDLSIDAHTHAHVHTGRLKTDGWVASPGVLRFKWNGDLPLEKLADTPASAQLPCDLQRAVKDKGYLRGAIERTLTAEVAVTRLQLERLATSGLLPQGSAGILSLSARLSGTPARPQLHLYSSGEEVTVGRLH